MADTGRFDLDAYLGRIGWQGGRRPGPETLRGVHLAHALSLPFENLDPLGGRVPSLAPGDLMAKMIHGRRGGYCYEHNTLLWLALEALGFRVGGLAARVVLGAATPWSRPRTHMMLRVEVPGEPQPYLADVGFGAAGALLVPLPLATGAESAGGGRRHRLMPLPGEQPPDMLELQMYDGRARDWVGQYAFTPEPFAAPDYEMFNWYIATGPRSPFNRRPYLQRTTARRHLALDGDLLTQTLADGTVTEHRLADEAEARRVIAEEFGVAVPEGLTLLRRLSGG
ncbi:arylamine N-acetyltransferase [Streptomyces monashensis]|uniref:arylamine N-acetyltransferase family protein n=1 Tax=Streptomyces monashensis TaxID=1678012 RepID=UPI0033F291FE